MVEAKIMTLVRIPTIPMCQMLDAEVYLPGPDDIGGGGTHGHIDHGPGSEGS